MAHVLFVDDEEKILNSFRKALKGMGHSVDTAQSGAEALEFLSGKECDVAVADLAMPGMDGITLLKEIKRTRPELPVIILTGHGTVETAVEAMKLGAFDYVTKPFNIDEMDIVIRRALFHSKLLAENAALKNQIMMTYNFNNIVGGSKAMQELYRIIDKVKDTHSTVMIVGESGTGKELIARAIHFNGVLADKPFVTVDCGALSTNLLESELFGHVRGSFTGAHKDKVGYFEAADGGTIFLDEIGEFSSQLQTRLLRALQDGAFSRVGESRQRKVNVRVIAATNRDLEAAVEAGEFREDLYYRLNVITIRVPSLAERLEDLPALLNHFLDIFNEKFGKKIESISEETISFFANYSWPGNVRELENVMESAMTFCDDEKIDLRHIPEPIKKRMDKERDAPRESLSGFTYKEAKQRIISDFDRDYLKSTLEECDWNITAAAQLSGMDRGCFYRLLRKYGLLKQEK